MTKQLLKKTDRYSLWLMNSSQMVFRDLSKPFDEEITINFTKTFAANSYFQRFITFQNNGYGWVVILSRFEFNNYYVYSSKVVDFATIKLSTVIKAVLGHYGIKASVRMNRSFKDHLDIVPKTDEDRAKFLVYFGGFVRKPFFDAWMN